MTPAYITSYNHLVALRRLVKDCYRLGLAPVIVDNDSDYPPLVDWLATNPCRVIRTGANFGGYAAWTSGIVQREMQAGWYVVTDSDLDLSAVPDDALAKMKAAFHANPGVVKVGLSLEIDDIPGSYPFKADVMTWERPYWTAPTPDGNWSANTDTTFALYHTDRPFEAVGSGNFFSAVRMAKPYTARHMPWYLDFDRLTEEQAYCFARTDEGLGYWSSKIKRRMNGEQ